MTDNRFDRISRYFAERRLSRRQAIVAGGASVAAAGLGPAHAHDATPVAPADASPEAADPGGSTGQYLFVQSYASGTITATDAPDRFTITLEGGAGQTVYFANRPSRDVGAAPTDRFLDGLGFSEENPPNAALVMEIEPGEQDIAVVELFNPRIAPDANTVAYDVEPLANWQQSLELGFSDAPTDLAELVPEFGAAHVFIDDCEDTTVRCATSYKPAPCPNDDNCGTFGPMGFCWSWSNLWCQPCEPWYHQNPTVQMVYKYWTDKCNDTFNACHEGGRSGCYPRFPGVIEW